MGRDTIQLENAVSTISQEYLLEFTSEYGIPEGLHPELPGPEETIVDFPKGKVDEKIFSIVVDWRTSAPNDGMPAMNLYSATDVTSLDTHPMDLFNLISAPNLTKVKTGTRPRAAHEVPLLTVAASRVIEDQVQNEVAYKTPPTGNASATGVTLETSLEKEVAAMRPPVNKKCRKRGNNEAKANAPPKVLRRDYDAFRPAKNAATVEVNIQFSVRSPESGRSSSAPFRVGSPGDFLDQCNITPARQVAMDSQLRLRFEQEVRQLKKASEAEADMKKYAEAKNAKLAKELDSLRAQFSDLQVSNKQLSDQVLNLQAQVMGEEKIKSTFEEFKKYKDDKVEQRCAKMDAHLDKLSVDFDEELYPHMLTTIAGHRWVIRHGLRLSVMKCVESLEIRQAFADVVSAGLAKGMSEGLKYGIEHESDTMEDAPQWIRDLRLSFSQLKILVYPEGQAILLADAATQTEARMCQGEMYIAMALLDHCTMGPKYIGKFFYPILVSLAETGLDSFTQALETEAVYYVVPHELLHLIDLAYGKVSKATDQTLGLLKVNFVPSGLVSISPTPDPSTHDDPFVNSVYSSCRVLIIGVSGRVSFGFSTRKSARICPFTDVRGRYVILCSPSTTLYFCNRPATSGRDINCLMGWSVMTTMGYAWKYLRNLLVAKTSGSTSFSIGTSLIVRGDGSCNTTFVLSGHGLILSGFIMYPRNIPSAAPNVSTNLSIKGFVYQSSVCCVSVLEAEGHFCVAIYPVTGVESCLFLILFDHLYLMVAFVGVRETLKGVAAKGFDSPIDFWKGRAPGPALVFLSERGISFSDIESVLENRSWCCCNGGTLSWRQDSTTDSHYSANHQKLKHSVSRGWYYLDFSYPRPSNDTVAW
nr:hypothetical protein [Tanacetum cinerariifolium]